MTGFHHHPDNWIFIRDNNQIYKAKLSGFLSDLGEPYSFDGRERIYQPGERHFVDNVPQPLTWAEGDRYISMISGLIDAKQLRLNPPLSQEEQEKRSDLNQVYQTLKGLAGRIEGKTVQSMDAEDLKISLGIIMFWSGMIDRTGKVKPVSEWSR